MHVNNYTQILHSACYIWINPVLRVKETEGQAFTVVHQLLAGICGLVSNKIFHFETAIAYGFQGIVTFSAFTFQLFMKSLHFSWIFKVRFY